MLGLKIADNIGINTLEKNDENMNFLYYWFLTCLYHDIGYIYEQHSLCEQLRAISIDGLEAIQEIYNIQYLHNREFKTYPKDIVDLYLKNRADCTEGSKGVVDHGIAGGLILYDRLRKQFEKSWKKRTDKLSSRKGFYVTNISGKKLHCSNKHYEDYAKAADAIIMHNIWISTLNEYLAKDGKMNFEQHKINLDNYLCFILCLADSIEPLKRVKPLKMANKYNEYINNVYFCFKKKSNLHKGRGSPKK